MGEKFHELLKVRFSQFKLSQIVGNDSVWVWQVATPTIMCGRKTKWDLIWAIVDWCYHVAVWEVAVVQKLPCEREGGNIHDPYAVTIDKNNDTAIDYEIMMPSNLPKILAFKTFADWPESTKFAKVFARERFPLYGIQCLHTASAYPVDTVNIVLSIQTLTDEQSFIEYWVLH